jgi:predicted transcriptional regulator YdeE
MAEITKVYRQSIPAVRFIGKRYGDGDRVNGMFGNKWNEWWKNGWFDIIEKHIGVDASEIYEDGDAYLGLMRLKENESFEYWIGMFLPEKSPIPDNFTHIDFTESKLGVCWVYGKEEDVCLQEGKCAERLKKEGIKIVPDEKGALWFFERYGCPRFTSPDDKGNIILDICYFTE